MELALVLVLGFALGASVASFLNVVADRMPSGQSIVSPPSHCPVCDHELKPYELVPVFSYVVQGGRCRVCDSRIPMRVPAVEALGGLAFAFVGWRYGITLDALLVATMVSFMLVIAIIDLEHKLVLNRVLLVAAPIALVSSALWSEEVRAAVWDWGGPELAQASDAAAAGLIGVVGLGLFVAVTSLVLGRRSMGMGDVKLLGVLGLWLGLRGLLVAFYVAAVVGGITAIILLTLRKFGRKDEIAFAEFLSLGATVSIVWGEDMLGWYLRVLT